MPAIGKANLWLLFRRATFSRRWLGERFDPVQIGDSVVVVSDGEDGYNASNVQRVEAAYWAKGIRIFLFEVIEHNLQTHEEQQGLEQSEELSRATGGGLVRVRASDRDRVLAGAREIEDQIWNYYLLRTALPEVVAKPTSLKLELLNSAGRRRKDVQLSYAEKLVPCVSKSEKD